MKNTSLCVCLGFSQRNLSEERTGIINNKLVISYFAYFLLKFEFVITSILVN